MYDTVTALHKQNCNIILTLIMPIYRKKLCHSFPHSYFAGMQLCIGCKWRISFEKGRNFANTVGKDIIILTLTSVREMLPFRKLPIF